MSTVVAGILVFVEGDGDKDPVDVAVAAMEKAVARTDEIIAFRVGRAELCAVDDEDGS